MDAASVGRMLQKRGYPRHPRHDCEYRNAALRRQRLSNCLLCESTWRLLEITVSQQNCLGRFNAPCRFDKRIQDRPRHEDQTSNDEALRERIPQKMERLRDDLQISKNHFSRDFVTNVRPASLYELPVAWSFSTIPIRPSKMCARHESRVT